MESMLFSGHPDRLSMIDIKGQARKVLIEDMLTSVLNSMPNIAMVLNSGRQVLYANDVMLAMLGLEEARDLLGLRPGEIVNCIHSHETPNGCGTADNCKFCGAVSAVIESIKTHSKVTRDARIVVESIEKNVQLDLRVTSGPIDLNGITFYIVTMVDIADEVRKRALERLFYHDILNSTTGLSGMVQMANMHNKDTKVGDLLSRAIVIIDDMSEDIKVQKDITSAERGELQLDLQDVDLSTLLEECVEAIRYSSEGAGIRKAWDIGLTINTDMHLLRRIVINLVKNALEADNEGKEVVVDLATDGAMAHIIVWNAAYIPPEVQAGLYQRSYSTKGSGRGLGTYSARMFTEEYLKGRISLYSTPEDGTTFTVSLPYQT
jgi:signal transduction histidine kinase